MVKKNSKISTLLFGVVRKCFCIPASSTTSGRVILAGGNIATYKLTRLRPENVDKLVFIQILQGENKKTDIENTNIVNILNFKKYFDNAFSFIYFHIFLPIINILQNISTIFKFYNNYNNQNKTIQQNPVLLT